MDVPGKDAVLMAAYGAVKSTTDVLFCIDAVIKECNLCLPRTRIQHQTIREFLDVITGINLLATPFYHWLSWQQVIM